MEKPVPLAITICNKHYPFHSYILLINVFRMYSRSFFSG
jgi:hypothetical protein